MNPPDDFDKGITTTKLLANFIIALVGGMVHHLASSKEYSVTKMLAGMAVGCFTGTIAYAVATHYGTEEWLKAAVTGMAGYTGAPLLDYGSKMFLKFIDSPKP